MSRIRIKSAFSSLNYILCCLPKIFKLVKKDKWNRKNRFILSRGRYSCIFSLGDRCVTADLLRQFGLREWAGPFDWNAGVPLIKRFELLKNKFRGFLEKKEYTDK